MSRDRRAYDFNLKARQGGAFHPGGALQGLRLPSLANEQGCCATEPPKRFRRRASEESSMQLHPALPAAITQAAAGLLQAARFIWIVR